MRRMKPPSSVLGRPPKSWCWRESSSIRPHQHGQPIAGAERGGQRVSAGSGAAEDVAGELGRGEHVELLVGELEDRLQAVAERGSAALSRGDQTQPLGRAALLDQPPEAALDHPRLAGPGRAAYDHAPGGMGDGGALGIGQPVEQPLRARTAGEQIELCGALAAFVLRTHRLTA